MQQKVVSFDVVQQVVTEGFAPMSVQFKDQIATLTKVLTGNGFRDVSVDDERSVKALAPVPDKRLSPLPRGLLRDLWQTQAPLRLKLVERNVKRSESWLFVLPEERGRRWLVGDGPNAAVSAFPATNRLVRLTEHQIGLESSVGWDSGSSQVSIILPVGESWMIKLNGH